MPLSPRQRRFLIRENGWVSGLIAVAVNGVLLAVGPLRGGPAVGDRDVFGDLYGTAFLLPFITTLIATPLVRRAVRAGVAEGAPLPTWPRLVGLSTFGRAVWFGVVGWILVGAPVAAADSVTGRFELPVKWFVVGKLWFVFVYASLATPPIARVAMADETPASRGRQSPESS